MVAQQSKKQTETHTKTKYFMSCSFANSAATTTTTLASINEAEGKETDGSSRSHREKPYNIHINMMALRLASEEQRNMLVSNCLWPKLEQIQIQQRRYKVK